MSDYKCVCCGLTIAKNKRVDSYVCSNCESSIDEIDIVEYYNY